MASGEDLGDNPWARTPLMGVPAPWVGGQITAEFFILPLFDAKASKSLRQKNFPKGAFIAPVGFAEKKLSVIPKTL